MFFSYYHSTIIVVGKYCRKPNVRSEERAAKPIYCRYITKACTHAAYMHAVRALGGCVGNDKQVFFSEYDLRGTE